MGAQAIPLQDIARKLFGQGGPNPLYPTPDQSQAPPSPAALASSQPSPTPHVTQPTAAPSPGTDGAALLYGSSAPKPPMSAQEFSAANPDAAKAYMPARPVGPFDKIPDGQPGADTWSNRHNVLRRALASLSAGAAEFGGDLNHHPGQGAAMVDRWNDIENQQRQYDANAPRMQAGALNQAYQNYLQQGGEQAGIEKSQAETHNLQANVPLLQHQQQFLDKVRTLKESGKYQSDDDLFKAVLPEASTVPGMTRQMIVEAINNSKALGPQFNLQADKGGRPEFIQTRTGEKVYPDAQGKFADPEMQKQWDSQMAAHSQALGEEEGKEKRVAGYAADRQAQAFANTQQAQNMQQTRERYNTALDADERLSRMERSFTKAKSGDQQAMLALLADHIGMTMGLQKGARITKDIINEAAQSQPWLEKIGAKFDGRGYLSGVTLGPDQMKQMLDLGYEARDRAWGSAQDASKLYSVPPPKGAEDVFKKRPVGSKPALEAEQGGGDVIYARDPQGKLHKAAKGTALPQGWNAENAPATK